MATTIAKMPLPVNERRDTITISTSKANANAMTLSHDSEHDLNSSSSNLMDLLHRSKLTFTAFDTSDLNNIQNQNIMRLRVNRVSIVQELNLGAILPILVKDGILTEADIHLINKGSTNYDKTRFFLDTLTTKEHKSNWYLKFRDALLSPDVDELVQRRHKTIYHFLDNTIIQKTLVLPKLKTGADSKNINDETPLPSISGSVVPQKVVSEKERWKLLEKNAKDKLFKNKSDYVFKITNIPEELLHVFNSWESKQKKKCIKLEKEAIKNIQKIELFVHNMKNSSPKDIGDNVYFCIFKAVSRMIKDRKFHHVYFKYVAELQNVHLLPLCTLISVSFIQLVAHLSNTWCSDIAKKLIKLAFNLVDFLTGIGEFGHAEQCTFALVTYLDKGSGIESLFPAHRAYVKLMQARLNNAQLPMADAAHHKANEYATKIAQLSFGKDFLNQSELHSLLSRLLQAQGSIQTAQSWSTAAINNIDLGNPFVVFQVMINSLQVYLLAYDELKSEKLAVAMVQHAQTFFGEYSPQYLEALSGYVKFSNIFRKDEFGFEVAKIAVGYSRVVFAFEHPAVAECYAQVAMAMCFLGEKYQDLALEAAFKAVQVGQSVYKPYHPLLAQLMVNFADVNLKIGGENFYPLSVSYCKLALAALSTSYGEHSLETCQAKVCLAKLYHIIGSDKEARKLFKSVHDNLSQSKHPKSHIFLQFLLQYAQFYKSVNQLDQAVRLAKQIVNSAESYGTYIRWLDEAYILAIQVLSDKGDSAARDDISAKRTKWLSTNPRHKSEITWQLLNKAPDRDFFKTFHAWSGKKEKIKSLLMTKKIPIDQKAEVKRIKKLIKSVDNTSKILRSESSSSSSDSEPEKKVKEDKPKQKKLSKKKQPDRKTNKQVSIKDSKKVLPLEVTKENSESSSSSSSSESDAESKELKLEKRKRKELEKIEKSKLEANKKLRKKEEENLKKQQKKLMKDQEKCKRDSSSEDSSDDEKTLKTQKKREIHVVDATAEAKCDKEKELKRLRKIAKRERKEANKVKSSSESSQSSSDDEKKLQKKAKNEQKVSIDKSLSSESDVEKKRIKEQNKIEKKDRKIRKNVIKIDTKAAVKQNKRLAKEKKQLKKVEMVRAADASSDSSCSSSSEDNKAPKKDKNKKWTSDSSSSSSSDEE